MRRILLLAAALAIPVSGASVALSGMPAWAGVSIVCTGANGPITGNLTISGCTGGNTGGGAVPFLTVSLQTGGTVHWLSGSTTSFGIAGLTPTSAAHCPGYVKGAVSNPTADKVNIPVTADTGNGIKVPGSAKGAVCISTGGNISLLKALKIK